MEGRSLLIKEYKRLLSTYGLIDPLSSSKKFMPEWHEKWMPKLREEEIRANEIEGVITNVHCQNKNIDLGENPSYQTLIDYLNKEIEDALKRLKIKLPNPVFAGEFPTGCFNALAYPYSNGCILLLNTGLTVLLYKFASAISHIIRFASFDASGNAISETIRGKSTLDYVDVILAISNIINEYRLTGSSFAAQRLPAISTQKGAYVGGLTMAANRFVLAHEYGHILLGHTKSPMLSTYKTPVGEINIITESWEKEIEADLKGCEIVLASVSPSLESSDYLTDISLNIAGTLFFFSLDDIVTRVVETIKDTSLTVESTHPPSSHRAKLVREYWERHFDSELLSSADKLVESISNIGDDIIARIKFDRMRTF